jgi:hypothetical protein
MVSDPGRIHPQGRGVETLSIKANGDAAIPLLSQRRIPLKQALVLVCFPLLAFATDVTGSWHFVLVRFGEEFADARVELKMEGTKLTGTLNELQLEGTADNDVVKIMASRPNGAALGTLEGRVTGDQMSGTVKQGDEQFEWKARRLKLSERAPQTHTFEPVKFHRLFSGAIESVMRIQPGDTVRSCRAARRHAGDGAFTSAGALLHGLSIEVVLQVRSEPARSEELRPCARYRRARGTCV